MTQGQEVAWGVFILDRRLALLHCLTGVIPATATITAKRAVPMRAATP